MSGEKGALTPQQALDALRPIMEGLDAIKEAVEAQQMTFVPVAAALAEQAATPVPSEVAETTAGEREPVDEQPDEREAFCWDLGLHLADALESMGVEDADLSDGRALADTVYCLGYRKPSPPAVAASTGTSEDVEALQRLIVSHLRADKPDEYDEAAWSAAGAVLASDWLAVREAAARAEALRTVAADMVWDFDDHPVTRSAVREWLNGQAAQIAREG